MVPSIIIHSPAGLLDSSWCAAVDIYGTGSRVVDLPDLIT